MLSLVAIGLGAWVLWPTNGASTAEPAPPNTVDQRASAEESGEESGDATENKEISSLTWEGWENGNPPILTLFLRDAKIGEPNQLPVVGPLRPILRRRLAARRLDCPYIFHSNGKSLAAPNGGLRKRFYAIWKVACEATGIPNLGVYDLRRSALRNLDHAGVSETDSMKISGHKTRETYRRYLIRDMADQVNAFERLDKYLAAARSESGGLVSIAEPGQIPDGRDEKGRKS